MAESEKNVPPQEQWLEPLGDMLKRMNGQTLALETAIFVIRFMLPEEQRRKVDEALRLFLSLSDYPEGMSEKPMFRAYTESLERILRDPKKEKTS